MDAQHVIANPADTAEYARATLLRWDEQLRLTLLDRGGSYYGRTSDRGMLQRFNDRADSEYELDLISYGFSLTENYSWYRRGRGARYWGGSVNKLRMVQEAEFAASIDLGASWVADVRFNHQKTYQANRSALRFGARKGFSDNRVVLFGTAIISGQKPESDVELGILVEPIAGTRVTVGVAALDLFNNLIYETLGVGVGVSDTALSYSAQPFAVRVGLDSEFGPFRVEAYALGVTPTTLTVRRQTEPDDGFAQDERFAYAGGLVAWEPTTRSSLGAFATWVRARTNRAALPVGTAEHDFDLTETTAQLGVYGIHRFGKFSLEGWSGHVWRIEDRVRPDTAVAPSIDYEDRAWVGRIQLTYRVPVGLRIGTGLDFTARRVIGDDRMPSLQDLDKNNTRLRIELGWQFGRRAMIFAGAGAELDSDIEAPGEGAFDGGHARLAVFF
jgi:hypothetical protein